MSVDVTIYRDADAVINAVINDDAGNSVDMTGATVSYRVSPRFDKRTNVLTIEGSVLDGPLAQIQAVIAPSSLDLLTRSQYAHQFNITLANGNTYPPVDGVLNILDTIPAA